MSLFKRAGTHKEVVCIIDVGSASVGAALVAFSDTSVPEVLFTTRKSLPISEHPHSDRLLASTSTLLKEALASVEKEGIPRLHALNIQKKGIEHILCVLASPWYVSQTKVFRVERKTPVTFSRAFVDDLLLRERQTVETNLKDSSYAEHFDRHLELLEQKVIQMKLNGYETANPYNKKTNNIEVSVFSSFVSKKIIQKFADILSHSFSREQIAFHTFGLASYSAVVDLFSEAGNFLLADITGEVTDLSVIKEGAIFESVSFPSGRNFLVRKIMKKLNTNAEVALSYLRMRAEKKIEPKIAVKIDEAIEDVKAEWLIYLDESLRELEQGGVLPKKIFITVDDDVADVFLEFLKSSSTAFSTLLLDDKQLSHPARHEKGVLPDPFIVLEALFFRKLLSLPREK